MLFTDINCDVGEGVTTDEAIMPYISSANIACAYHAGDAGTMMRTVELCIKHNVTIGAHPSFPDKENFGRTEMDLHEDVIYELVIQQLFLMNEIALSFDVAMHHVKPHGALYNLSARNMAVAKTIARAVKDFNKDLVLYGLSGSYSILAAKAAGLRTANEVFADRTYQDDGSLTARSQFNALIETADKAIQQVLQMVKLNTVTSVNGNELAVIADTICIHGDGKHAVEFAKAIQEAFIKERIQIKAVP